MCLVELTIRTSEGVVQAYMVRLGMAGFNNMDELICDLKK